MKAETCENCGRGLPVESEWCQYCGYDNHRKKLSHWACNRIRNEITDEAHKRLNPEGVNRYGPQRQRRIVGHD